MPSSAPALLALAGLAGALLALPAAAHESEGEALARLELALAVAPRDAELWRRRAALERARGEIDLSGADLERACALGLAPALAEQERGALARAAGRPADAERHLRRARELAPDNAATLAAHAEALAGLGRWREAADAYARAIRLAPQAGPDLHLARARALAAGGDATLGEALRALDEAEAELGPIPALVQEGALLELRAGRSDAALARLGRLPPPTRRRERWLVQRAEILERAGRPEQAIAEYAAALASIEALAPARRSTPAAVTLAARAREGIGRLSRPAEARAR
ncbi:MAG TPA: tetratricopeptide repeat protein [Myxococcota bacterium]|jgi:tetratricopeptide (TPR) repeat protein